MISKGTLVLIELALETGTPPKEFNRGTMYDPRVGPCFFGWCGQMLGAKLDGGALDTWNVERTLDASPISQLPVLQIDRILRNCDGDSQFAIPQIMQYLRSHVETNDPITAD